MDSHDRRACVLVEHLPDKALCGIDLLSFTTNPRFHGIKSIPRGWHFVFAASNDSFSIRYGSWTHIKTLDKGSAELLVKKWDLKNEELISEDDEAALLKSRANLGSIWHEGLTTYRQPVRKGSEHEVEDYSNQSGEWERLTDCINEHLLNRVLGIPDNQGTWSLTSASTAAQDADDIPGLTEDESSIHQTRDLSFLPIDLKQTWRDGAIGRERTEAAQDRSWALQNLVSEYCKDFEDVIGEFQFAFVMTLTLNNTSCLEQWKRILNLVLTSKAAVMEQSLFFIDFLRTLKWQLKEAQSTDGGLFDLSDEGSSLLRILLRRFRKGLEQLEGKQKSDVIDELDELEEFLISEFGLLTNESHVTRGKLQLEDGEEVELALNGADEDDESGEYAPTIVDLTAAESEALNISNTPSVPSVQGMKNQHDLSSIPRRAPSHENTASESESDEDLEDLDLEEMDSRF